MTRIEDEKKKEKASDKNQVKVDHDDVCEQGLHPMIHTVNGPEFHHGR